MTPSTSLIPIATAIIASFLAVTFAIAAPPEENPAAQAVKPSLTGEVTTPRDSI